MYKEFLSRTVACFSFIAALSFCVGSAKAQDDTVHFSKGLFLSSASRYGREAISTDPLAYKLFNHTLLSPVALGLFGKNEKGEDMSWAAVTADSLHRFRSRGGFGGGGYYYFTYESDKERIALLNVKGNSALFFNGEPHGGDAYASGWLYIPVKLKKGLNELYVRGGQVVADLIFPSKPVTINTQDPTLPSVVLTHDNHRLVGALVIINASPTELKGLRMVSMTEPAITTTPLPPIPPMSTRKVPFTIDGSAISAKGRYPCKVWITSKDKKIDETEISLEAVAPTEKYSETFISLIDGSIQYYAVTPQLNGPQKNAALFLSVHGAGVEAIGQAKAYQSKDWGTLVAATNRRPRGFNWEDWGRLDALEVLEIAKAKFNPDPQHIYLTGHSMGGHGTWYLGATYPDKWAAIGACSGYPTLKGYGSADGLIPDSSHSPIEQMLLRGSNPSDVLKLAKNYKTLGVYILHGDADRTVSVNYARQMRKLLADFHTDLSYYEYPGGEHWFGDQSVDWKPLFEFFKWHKLAADTSMDKIEFVTANPGISSSYRWAAILQQEHPLQYTRISFTRNKSTGTISGITENARMLRLNLKDLGPDKKVRIQLDGTPALDYTTKNTEDEIFLKKTQAGWAFSSLPSGLEKTSIRYGTFKDPFNYKMVFIYSTAGTAEENQWSFNKARFDAETWYYRANGAVDIMADKDYLPSAYPDRNVLLYGNASTNKAWKLLLADCPIQVERGKLSAGKNIFSGDGLAAYFTWPIRSSKINSVGVITGTGVKGMNATLPNQYFAGGSGFPDFMIFTPEMLLKGSTGIKMAGYFDNNWQLNDEEMVVQAD